MQRKEYFEIPWASLRSLVQPSFAERSIINHKEYLPHAQIIVSDAVDITETTISTAEGHVIAYDYLVIATGHVYTDAPTKSAKISYYQTEHEKISSSKSILIIGGGPTGVELAAEIAVEFPDKKVTLVHRGSRLLEFIGHNAGKKALDWLSSRKVEVIMGQSVNLTSVSERVYQTSSGETITADCLFDCTLWPMGSTWLKKTILNSSLDIHGRLMVDENLRVKGHENIFGIGDITDIPEIKQGHTAQKQALVAIKNLKLLMTGSKCKLSTYRASWPIAFVSLGRNDAVAQILFVTLIGWIPGLIKSRDLFVGKTRKNLGLNSECI
ncbi:NADH:ubiquinone reductase (non-electrogenic) [Bertholletia excelsa]